MSPKLDLMVHKKTLKIVTAPIKDSLSTNQETAAELRKLSFWVVSGTSSIF